jgi:hypothetical protein
MGDPVRGASAISAETHPGRTAARVGDEALSHPPGPPSHNFLKVLSDLVELAQRGLPLCRSSPAKTVAKVSVVSDTAGEVERGTPIHRS